MLSDLKENTERLADTVEELIHKINQRIMKIVRNKENLRSSQEFKHPNNEFPGERKRKQRGGNYKKII